RRVDGLHQKVRQPVALVGDTLAVRYQRSAVELSPFLCSGCHAAGLVDVELGIERPPEARAPALRPAVLVNEDVGLERAETLLAHLAADRLDAVEVGDRWLVPVGMVDAPRGAGRPVEPDAVALLAAEQLVARHAKPLGLGVEQRILDRP